MIIVDIEASGIDYRRHSLLSIGAIDLTQPDRRFYGECRMWEGATHMPDSLAINGFTPEACNDPTKDSLQELMEKFLHWVEASTDKTLGGQNVSFDRDFLNDSFSRSHISWHFSYRTVDLHSVAYTDMVKKGVEIPMKNNRAELSLTAILAYVGLPEEPKPHHGLTGALMEAEAFSRLLYEKNLLPEFVEYPLIHIH